MPLEYARHREAFGKALTELDTVQQRLAEAATRTSGLLLLAEQVADADGLAYGGPAACAVLAECHQVLGAIGYTLEYPLQRYSRRARAIQLWADAWIGAIP
jgi:alkylation response protein AidB-like acyl-CoA dehydrogenase